MTTRTQPTAAEATSRAEFEAAMLKQNACVRLARQRDELGGHYRTVTVQRAWNLWQSAWTLSASRARAFHADKRRIAYKQGHADALSECAGHNEHETCDLPAQEDYAKAIRSAESTIAQEAPSKAP